MKILSYGHLPTWAGGRQETGAANVIYQLAKYGSEIDGTEVIVAATDCFEPERKDGKLIISGWTKGIIICYVLSHPFASLNSFKKIRQLIKRYPSLESWVGLFVKRLFLARAINKYKPDVVHFHGTSSIMFFLDLVPDEIKVANTIHGMAGTDENIKGYKTFHLLENDEMHSKRIDGLFFICSSLRKDFENEYGQSDSKNFVVLNSYDQKSFYYDALGYSQRSEFDVTVLCTLASLSDRKGQQRVLSALSSLPKREGFRYFCIGIDSEGISDEMERIASEKGIDFKYLGKMNPNEIREHICKADYMIMPSSSEGFGITYLEAIACGVPVIIPKNLPIVREKNLITERNSLLLDDCSSEAISRLLSQINDFHFDHKSVSESVSGFTWDSAARQYYEYFKTL